MGAQHEEQRMTDTNQTTLSGSESHADGPEGLPEGAGTEEPQANEPAPDPRIAKLSRENADWRGKLRSAEERIATMQRAEVERLAADGLSHPADLFSLSGNDVANYLTEDGDVDAVKVAADFAAILAERPGMRKFTPGYDPSQGLGGRPPKGQPSFSDLIKI
jgi:hypothetical protein